VLDDAVESVDEQCPPTISIDGELVVRNPYATCLGHIQKEVLVLHQEWVSRRIEFENGWSAGCGDRGRDHLRGYLDLDAGQGGLIEVVDIGRGGSGEQFREISVLTDCAGRGWWLPLLAFSMSTGTVAAGTVPDTGRRGVGSVSVGVTGG
jgi:hypothetical protein